MGRGRRLVADINVYYGLITCAQQYVACSSVAYVQPKEAFSNFGKSLVGDCEGVWLVFGDTLPCVTNGLWVKNPCQKHMLARIIVSFSDSDAVEYCADHCECLTRTIHQMISDSHLIAYNIHDYLFTIRVTLPFRAQCAQTLATRMSYTNDSNTHL